MRNIVLDLAVSLDGYIEGPQGEYDWCIMDDVQQFFDFLDSVDTVFYGRKSYELFGKKGVQEVSSPEEEMMVQKINSKQKYVFSGTVNGVDAGDIVVRDRVKETVQALRQKNGKDIWLFGGANLVTSFVHLDLIDVFRLSVHPIILGSGKTLFNHAPQRMGLALTRHQVMPSGVVQLEYRRTGNRQ
jgi:dihydrofolate reductase